MTDLSGPTLAVADDPALAALRGGFRGDDVSMRSVFGDLLSLVDREIPFDLWMITRTEGDEWIVLQSNDRHFGVERGQVLRWSDSLCSRMIAGLGPVYAPDIDAVPVYRDAPVVRELGIASYLGVPIRLRDGSLFGTLCAIGPGRRAEGTLSVSQQQVVATVVRSLGLIIDIAQQRDTLSRRTLPPSSPEQVDADTGLANRAGFLAALKREQARVDDLGSDACVVVVLLDHLRATEINEGAAVARRLVQAATESLCQSTRDHDLIARTSADTFSLMLPGMRSAAADEAAERIRARLAVEGVWASIGSCGYRTAGSFLRAWTVALGLAGSDRPSAAVRRGSGPNA